MSNLYSVSVHECPECAEQMCRGILKLDLNSQIVLHVSSATSIKDFKNCLINKRVSINPHQFKTYWGCDFTRVHASNYAHALHNSEFQFNISYVIFLGSNCLVMKDPSNFMADYKCGFTIHDHVPKTPPEIGAEYLGWWGDTSKDPRFLSVMSELENQKKYGCVIDGAYVSSEIMERICYLYDKYYDHSKNKDAEHIFTLEERLIPTIACNSTNKISRSLAFWGADINGIKDSGEYFIYKGIERKINNEFRMKYQEIIIDGRANDLQ